MKAAFLDRDGTITKDYPDMEWKHVRAPVFLEGALEALRLIRSRGYAIIIVTNQYLIGEGSITLADYNRFNAMFLDTLRANGIDILDVFFCPHARTENCICCKPKPGLIWQALQNYPAIDLDQSFMAGDSDADLQLADTVGLQFFGIGLECEHTIRCLREIDPFI